MEKMFLEMSVWLYHRGRAMVFVQPCICPDEIWLVSGRKLAQHIILRYKKLKVSKREIE